MRPIRGARNHPSRSPHYQCAFATRAAPWHPRLDHLGSSPDSSEKPLAFFPEMPIYEFRCPQGHVFEVFQRMNDPQPEGCEVCGQGPLERVLHPAAIHYKGSGFYATDYGRGSRRQVKEASGSDSTSSGDSGKSESKSESNKSDSSS